jgi:hypothetical protein
VAFANAVRAAKLPGIGYEDVEQSFVAGDLVRYGADGSMRTDVTFWDEQHSEILAIFDLKTGKAKLTDARIDEMRLAVKRGDSLPVLELRVDRR